MILKSTVGKKKHRFWHKIKLIFDNGFTKYYECTKCNTRIVVQPDSGYQPINYKWLYFNNSKGSFSVSDNVGIRYYGGL